ncbi:MAG: ATP-binding cassette domain-containing protein [Dactylosporangium sp.]|nr:ATP-binding cassette domain-containing protein [Dactylosporangium sp.]NNJ63766.1 ATP-binding cassette domain-containing protein [Dactylosporangium sp.]
MALELRRRAVAESRINQTVGEAVAHARDSGQTTERAFGLPEAYAAQVASSLMAHVARARPRIGEVRLAARGIGKRYRRRWVIRDVDLVVRAGQTAAVVGANGTGKSTFLAICAGFLTPDAGQVTLHGAVGFCPQDGGTLDYLRPAEHFALLGAGRGTPRAEARRTGRDLAATLQWNADSDDQARHLSGGTRQKLNLVLAALGDPEILLLDEPYQGFDQGTYLDFWDQVWQWRDRGKAVVVVTHLLENLDRVDTVLDLTPRVSEAEA